MTWGPPFAQMLPRHIVCVSLAMIGYWIGPDFATKAAQENKDQTFFSHLKGIFWQAARFSSMSCFSALLTQICCLECHGCCSLSTNGEDLERRSCQSRKLCSCLVDQGIHSSGSLECHQSIKIDVKSDLDTKSCFFHQAKPFSYNDWSQRCLNRKNLFGLFLDFCWHYC